VFIASGLADYAVACFWVALFLAPITIAVWALLDAASRPAWVWALARRSRVAWMVAAMVSVPLVFAGLPIVGYYLLTVRPTLRAVESGDLSA